MKRSLELFRGVTIPSGKGTRRPIVQSFRLVARRDGVLWSVKARDANGELVTVRRPKPELALRAAAELMRGGRWHESRTEAASEARSFAGWRNQREAAAAAENCSFATKRPHPDRPEGEAGARAAAPDDEL